MRPRYFSSASALFCVGVSAMVKPDSREVQPGLVGRKSPPDRLAVETFHVRAGPTTTSAGRQPTKSTPYAVPLTTTFFPPDSCNVGQLTQLAPPGYFIWLNEPVPVPGTTITDCYPSEFMEYYSTYRSDATTLQSRVPMMSPLVCPFGWQVVSEQDDYQACCPSGYKLTPPRTPLDPKRPAYGGTCYSEWKLSSTAFVDVYGPSSLSGKLLIVASTTPFAAYAHVIDGIAMATSSSQASGASSPLSSSPLPADSSSSGQSASLSGGAIAGIVIGAIAGLSILAVAGFMLARRRRRMNVPPVPPPKDHKDEIDTSTVRSPTITDVSINSPTAFKRSHTGVSEMAAGESHIHELEAGGRPIEKP